MRLTQAAAAHWAATVDDATEIASTGSAAYVLGPVRNGRDSEAATMGDSDEATIDDMTTPNSLQDSGSAPVPNFKVATKRSNNRADFLTGSPMWTIASSHDFDLDQQLVSFASEGQTLQPSGRVYPQETDF